MHIIPQPDTAMDVLLVSSISIVPLVLKIVAHTTEMGFVAVARVTPEQWVACEVHDRINFGLIPGGELKVDTTICHEIRQTGKEVVIDNVDNDEVYWKHHTPAMYGFKSYISVPVNRQNGSFFGTLCAIDPNTALLSTPEIVGMMRLFADLISFHLNVAEQSSVAENRLLQSHTAKQLEDLFAAVLNEDAGENKNNQSVPPVVGPLESMNTRTTRFAATIKEAGTKITKLLQELKTLQNGRL